MEAASVWTSSAGSPNQQKSAERRHRLREATPTRTFQAVSRERDRVRSSSTRRLQWFNEPVTPVAERSDGAIVRSSFGSVLIAVPGAKPPIKIAGQRRRRPDSTFDFKQRQSHAPQRGACDCQERIRQLVVFTPGSCPRQPGQTLGLDSTNPFSRGSRGGMIAGWKYLARCDPIHGGVFSDGRPSVHGVAPSPTAPASSCGRDQSGLTGRECPGRGPP